MSSPEHVQGIRDRRATAGKRRAEKDMIGAVLKFTVVAVHDYGSVHVTSFLRLIDIKPDKE